jgi:hypothetical protein
MIYILAKGFVLAHFLLLYKIPEAGYVTREEVYLAHSLKVPGHGASFCLALGKASW